MSPDSSQSALVSLVGAGPGDPGLLTVKARERLAAAHAVVYDALVNPEILRDVLGRPDVELHDVGKRGGAASSARQDDITALLVRLGREGKRVVRLKGGDPFVFGRGSEEAEALAAAHIPFEIVPGVTAGVAAPAYAGIPITHRGLASAVTFVTGHEDPAKGASDTDWSALARVGGTLVLYMGVKRLPDIARALVEGGLAADTPAAVISWGTYPRQRTVHAPLDRIAAAVRDAGLTAPSITVIGEVARLRDTIAWYDRLPLHGLRIVVTRARPQTSELRGRLAALGAEVIEAPAIRIEPLDAGPLAVVLDRLLEYDWVVFTSQNAVEIVWDALRATGRDARAFAAIRLAAVGSGTAQALLERGLAVDVVPSRSVAEGLAQALADRDDVRGARVLFARAESTRDVLPSRLREAGATVDEISVYRTVADPAGAVAAREALAHGDVDLVTFTSGSTVRFFLDAVGALPSSVRVGTMGPITSETARSLGLAVDFESPAATIDAFVAAIIAWAAGPHARSRRV